MMATHEEVLRLERGATYDIEIIGRDHPLSDRALNPGRTYRLVFDRLATTMHTGWPLRMEMENPITTIVWGQAIAQEGMPEHIYVPAPNEVEEDVKTGIHRYLIESITLVEGAP